MTAIDLGALVELAARLEDDKLVLLCHPDDVLALQAAIIATDTGWVIRLKPEPYLSGPGTFYVLDPRAAQAPLPWPDRPVTLDPEPEPPVRPVRPARAINLTGT